MDAVSLPYLYVHQRFGHCWRSQGEVMSAAKSEIRIGAKSGLANPEIPISTLDNYPAPTSPTVSGRLLDASLGSLGRDDAQLGSRLNERASLART